MKRKEKRKESLPHPKNRKTENYKQTIEEWRKSKESLPIPAHKKERKWKGNERREKKKEGELTTSNT